MNIVWKKIADLKPNPANPRIIPEEAVIVVMQSLKQNGWTQPLLIDSEDMIYIGHTRTEAARRLDMTEAPCYIREDLTKKELAALMLVDNRSGEFSGWDMEKLAKHVNSMELTAADMPGFGEDEVNTLIELGKGLYDGAAGAVGNKEGSGNDSTGKVQLTFSVPRERAQSLRERIEKLIADDA